MTDTPRAATMTVPVTMKIGPVPGDLTSFAQVFTFVLANIKKILTDSGVKAVVSGELATITYADGGGKSESFTATGEKIDDRHFRVQPDDQSGHSLEVSVDGGKTFAVAASFSNHAMADAIGRAWSEGRTGSAR